MMRERDITSRDNPAVKRYVQLATSRKARKQAEQFVAEGMKLVSEAVRAGYPLIELFATENALERYEELFDLAAEAEQFHRVSDIVADKLAQSQTPQGVFAVFQMLDKETQIITIKDDGRYLLLSSLQDPGNIGTILRTAAAFGLDGVFLSNDCSDLYSPKVLRATMGGVFKLPYEVVEDLSDCVARLQKAGILVYAAALREDAVSVCELSLGKHCAVMIGNEGNGLPEKLVALCDQVVILPMRPDSESLNAAMAAGILMWEMVKEN